MLKTTLTTSKKIARFRLFVKRWIVVQMLLTLAIDLQTTRFSSQTGGPLASWCVLTISSFSVISHSHNFAFSSLPILATFWWLANDYGHACACVIERDLGSLVSRDHTWRTDRFDVVNMCLCHCSTLRRTRDTRSSRGRERKSRGSKSTDC